MHGRPWVEIVFCSLSKSRPAPVQAGEAGLLTSTQSGTPARALSPDLYSITRLPRFSQVFMHLELLALTYWLNFITVCHYKSKLLGWPRDEKANQYSQYLPPLISVACVSLLSVIDLKD